MLVGAIVQKVIEKLKISHLDSVVSSLASIHARLVLLELGKAIAFPDSRHSHRFCLME